MRAAQHRCRDDERCARMIAERLIELYARL
jgi:hypothetical protein